MFEEDTLSGSWAQLLATAIQQFPRDIAELQRKYLIDNPTELGAMLKRTLGRYPFPRSELLMASPYKQLEIVRGLNRERNWGFTRADFNALGEPPPWPGYPLRAVVLEVQLDTIQVTFQEACNQLASWLSVSTDLDPSKLQLIKGVQHSRGLRWRVLDLEANWDHSPNSAGVSTLDVRSAETSPHVALLWAAVYFPEWVKAMDGRSVPFVSLPGYYLKMPNDQRHWTPYFKETSSGRNGLGVSMSDFSSRTIAVPTYVG